MFKSLEINQFNSEERGDIVLVDVRTEREHAEGHIKDSLNINVMTPSFVQEVAQLDKEKSYYLYCRSGGRSASAAQIMMQDLGFSDVTNLEGGMLAWMGDIES